MSGVVKQRAGTPSHPQGKAQTQGETQPQSISDTKRASNGSATLSYPAEISDDVNMNEVDGLVSLDVTLPDGKHMDITVDYNTPMLDLLVCLAGKSKLSPSGLLLQLYSEDSNSTLTYKPNQVIGALGGRHVRLVNKKAQGQDKGKNKSGKKQQPFEITHRFTVNLPRGQKTVLRVSPAMTLGDLMTSVCRDKDLDSRRHLLQLPGKPGVPVDLGITIGQLGSFEISLIHVSSVQERNNHTVSMPDLSQVPTYMPTSGETKKKRGFLSFLSKKERKFKPQDSYNIETSSNASHSMSMSQTRRSSPPPNQRRVSDTGLESARPKSMFVSSNPDSTEFSLSQRDRSDSQVTAPTRKKRKAPAPPAPGESLTSLNSSSKQDINANEDKDKPVQSQNGDISHTPSAAPNLKEPTSSVPKSQSVSSRAEMLSRFHSRNSSDSSGYHELTLSGCESPEAGHTLASKSKTSIDSASIESSDINNGLDSGIHESPVRVSPIEEVLEKSDSAIVASMPAVDNNDDNAIKYTTLPLPSRKKKKAPAPPAPSLPSSTEQTVADSITADTQYQSVQESPSPIELSVSSEIALTNSEVISPPASFDDSTTATQSGASILHMEEDPDLSDEDVNDAFDINDILDNVTFDDEPRPLQLQAYSTMNGDSGKDDENAMIMMETSSITSENIEQVEPIETLSKSDRPCAFIPPPPPTEPPPPEIETVDMGGQIHTSAPVLIDKETEVNDDNTSLAPASMKNSPESDRHLMRTDSFSSLGSVDTIEGLNLDFQMAIRMGEETLSPYLDDVEVSQEGYKNEMARFVERMSKMAMENGDGETNQLNDSLSSGVSVSETNSDTGSVIQHLRTDSSDSKSGLDSGSWSKKDVKKINDIEETDEIENQSGLRVSEEISVPVETVPPPPEFDDVDKKNLEDNDYDDDEEEYTETIEEIIIPLGPNGYDFSAARKVPDLETPKEHNLAPKKENEIKPVKNGVFRAEPVSIKPQSSQAKDKKEEKPKKEPEEKEEFILTTDDLSSVSFLPPRPKAVYRAPEPEPEKPKTSVSSAVLIMGNKSKFTSRSEEDASTESIQSRVSQLSFTPRSEPETDSMLEVKPISLLNRPTMRASNKEEISVSISTQPFPDDEEILTESNNLVHREPAVEDIVEVSSVSMVNSQNGGEIVEDTEERPSSRSSEHSVETREQQSQYDMLQQQFAQWQDQLARNQSILSQATAGELQADQLQQLTTQMTMQQNMMLQIQSTMQTLQQQQAINGGNGDKAASVEFPSADVEPAAAAAEPLPPPPPPAPPAPAASGTKAVDSPGKSAQAKIKSRPKPKFERELDPREQLMIAIRSFQGREGLKPVAKKDTSWVHSNR